VIVVWLLALIGGLAAAAYGSRRAVTAALDASSASSIPPTVVGLTLIAVGTDLPEIANSIAAAFGGHGDLLVGDAAGSALTQVTLILGLLCLGSTPIHADRTTVLTTGTLTAVALLVGAALVRDESLARWEGGLLVVAWIASIIAIQRRRSADEVGVRPPVAPGSTARHVAVTVAWLAVVGAAATLVVESFIELSGHLGVPELVASAIVLSLGTSLPELVVDWTAIRRGAVALAIGDLFGSSLLDATLALGIGPMMRSVAVSPTAATACIIAALGVTAATVITGSRPTHGRSSATLLFLVYAVATIALVVGTA
jgi:cation:H+ antiporter